MSRTKTRTKTKPLKWNRVQEGRYIATLSTKPLDRYLILQAERGWQLLMPEQTVAWGANYQSKTLAQEGARLHWERRQQ